MIVKITVTHATAIVRDDKSRPVGINTYLLPAKLSRAEVKEMFETGRIIGDNQPDPTIGTTQYLDKIWCEKLEITVSESELLKNAGITTGITSGEWTAIPFAEEVDENEQ